MSNPYNTQSRLGKRKHAKVSPVKGHLKSIGVTIGSVIVFGFALIGGFTVVDHQVNHSVTNVADRLTDYSGTNPELAGPQMRAGDKSPDVPTQHICFNALPEEWWLYGPLACYDSVQIRITYPGESLWSGFYSRITSEAAGLPAAERDRITANLIRLWQQEAGSNENPNLVHVGDQRAVIFPTHLSQSVTENPSNATPTPHHHN